MCGIRKELLETAWEYFTVEEGKCIPRQMRKGIENITKFVFLNKTSILLPCAMTTVESKTSLTTPLETIETSWYLAGWLDMSKSSRLLLYHVTNCALWGLKPYLSAQTLFYSLNPDHDIITLAINGPIIS